MRQEKEGMRNANKLSFPGSNGIHRFGDERKGPVSSWLFMPTAKILSHSSKGDIMDWIMM
jgi:hypothetical protein